MFSILRFILIVGAIFYYSPVRQQGEGTAAIEAFFTPKKSEPAAPAPPPRRRVRAIWRPSGRRLPDSAKQAVVDKILTTSGLPVADAAKPADTLQPEDRQPAGRGTSRAREFRALRRQKAGRWLYDRQTR